MTNACAERVTLTERIKINKMSDSEALESEVSMCVVSLLSFLRLLSEDVSIVGLPLFRFVPCLSAIVSYLVFQAVTHARTIHFPSEYGRG